MTETLTPREERTAWPQDRPSPKLGVTCPDCGHVAHVDRCRVPLTWWQRLWRGTRTCYCVPWGAPR